MSMKNFNNTFGNRTLDLPACSAVPEPTAPPRAPWRSYNEEKNNLGKNRKEFHAFRQSLFDTRVLYIFVCFSYEEVTFMNLVEPATDPCTSGWGGSRLHATQSSAPISSTLCLWWWQGFLPHCICVLFCLKRDLRGFLSCVLLHVTEFAHSLLLIPICTAVGTMPAWFCPFPTGYILDCARTCIFAQNSCISYLTWTDSWFLFIITITGFLQATKKHGRPNVFRRDIFFYIIHVHFQGLVRFNPLNPVLNPIHYLLALLGAHHFLHVSRIRVKLLTFRLLMSYIYGAPILDVSRSHTTTQHSR